ncbi:Yip1 family protein [Sinobaca sp. H24]|uniref:Yip1 family protein n=1 Tax=Sinobaca sp. H24 TaxID=2923376 RepID=UPI002079C454|nr:Yip1 family protein [Sinobaca sp. H24]
MLSNLFRLMINPRKQYAALKEQRPLLPIAFSILALSIITSLFEFSFLPVAEEEEMLSQPVLILIATAGTVVLFFVIAAFMKLIAVIFEGKATYKEMMEIYGLSLFPYIIILPVTVLLFLLHITGIITETSVIVELYSIAVNLLTVWSFILIIGMFGEANGFSIGKSIGAAVVSFIITIVIFIVLLIVIVASIGI